MDTLTKPIQFSEEISYPDGINVIIVEGTGDETRISLIPKITLTVSPSTIFSDGSAVFTCVAKVTDPNSTSTFIDEVLTEKITVTSETEFSTGNYIKTLTWDPVNVPLWDADWDSEYQVWCREQTYGIWKYYGGDTEEDFIYGGVLYLDSLDDKDHHLVKYDDLSGEPFQQWEILCRYKGHAATVAFSTGSKTSVPDDVSEVTWTPGEEVCADGTGTSGTAVGYCMPDAGTDGALTITATYEGVEASLLVYVDVGDLGDCNISISADPSSVSIDGTSTITAILSSGTTGKPLNGKVVDFCCLTGKLGSLSASSAITKSKDDDTDDVDSTDTTTISTSNAINSITSIVKREGVTAPDWTYDGNATFSGSEIKLNDSNALPLEVYPLTVTYSWGGMATVIFTGKAFGDAEIAAFVDSTHNANCKVTVDASSVLGGLTIEPDPSQIEPLETSSLNISCVDENGNGMTGSVSLHISRGTGDVPSSVSLGTKSFTAEESTTSSRWEVTTKYSVASVQSVWYAGVDYFPGGSFTGNTITCGRIFPSAGLPVTVDYNANGFAVATFEAPAIDEFDDVWGEHTTSGRRTSCTITVGNPGEPHPVSLEFTGTVPETDPIIPSKAYVEGSWSYAVISYEMKDADGAVPAPELRKARLSLVESPGYVSAVGGSNMRKLIELTADNEGKGSFWYIAPVGVECEANVNGCYADSGDADIYKGEVVTTKVTVKFKKTTYETSEINMGTITVKFNPKTKDQSFSTGVSVWSVGAGGDADENGSYDGNPADSPMVVKYTPSSYSIPAGVSISGQKVDGGGASLYPGHATESATFWVQIPWTYEANKRSYTVNVTAANDPDSGIQFAKVTVQGKTVETDVDGKAVFYDLAEGTWPIYIAHSNYLNNREPEVGGGGTDYDVDAANDSITVDAAPTGEFLLDIMDVSINLTLVLRKAVSDWE